MTLWLSAAASFAADVPASPSPPLYRPTPVLTIAEWTGLYFGINAGYGWARDTSTIAFTGTNLGGFTTQFGLGATELSGAQVSGAANLRGGIAGGQIGFNWQSGAIVFGGEVDAQWSGQRNTFAVNCNLACTASESARIKSITTARARIGYAFDAVMAYVTGGAAFVSAVDNLTMTIGGVTASFPALSTTVLGWTAGVGVEVNLWSHWSAKVEYLYIGANTLSASAGIPTILGSGTASEAGGYRDSIVRVGVNYRFGPSGRTMPILPPPVYSPAYATMEPRNLPVYSSTKSAPAPNINQVARSAASRPSYGDDGLPLMTDSADAISAPNDAVTLPKVAGVKTGTTDFIDTRPTKPAPRERSKTENNDEELRRVMDICRGC